MAFNGAGVFSRLYNWATDRDAAIKIRADRMDAEMDGFATGLSTALCKDGQQVPTANLPMGTFRHTGVGAGVSRTDYARLAEVQDSTMLWGGTDTGAADAWVFALSPTVSAYVAGQMYGGKIGTSHTNTGIAATVNFGGGTKPVIMPESGNPPIGALVAGLSYRFMYDGTSFVLLNPSDTDIPAPQGRLTVTSATPVITVGVSSATTVYYTPYAGNTYSWYNGTAWTKRCFAELSIALDNNSGHTGYQQSGKNFDLFLTVDSGTDRLVTGPAWSSNTARSASITRLNGRWVNSGSITARFGSSSGNTVAVAASQGTYVGTMRATADGTTTLTISTVNTPVTLGLWNCYNRVLMSALEEDTGASYSYSSATSRQARGSANNQVNLITGLAEDTITSTYFYTVITGGSVNDSASFAIGLDSTTAAYRGYSSVVNLTGTATYQANTITEEITPQIGWHFIAPQESASSATASTFNSDSANTIWATIPA